MAQKRPALKVTTPTEGRLQARLDLGTSNQGVPAIGRTVAIGVGLKESEVHELDRIATENEITRNALLRIAVRRFLEDERTGKLDLTQYVEVTTKKRLKLL